MNEHQMVRVQI